jgi:soluble lytic murein transglycosylase-like protein
MGSAAIALAGVPAADAHDSYLVQPGDSLTALAARFDTTVARLARANRLGPGEFLLVGTRLRIPSTLPPPTRYTVQPGDNLTLVAQRFGTTVQAVAAANRIEEENLVQEGSTLVIPARRGPAAAAPAEVVERARAALDRWAEHYDVDARLVRAVAWMESGYQHHVVSPGGARGVMQVLPVTWDYVETVLVGHRVEPTLEGNVRVGVAYLRQLLREFDGDERLAVGGYYQGPRAVRERGLFGETEEYVEDVLALKERM